MVLLEVTLHLHTLEGVIAAASTCFFALPFEDTDFDFVSFLINFPNVE